MSTESSNGNGTMKLVLAVFSALVIGGAVTWAGTGQRALDMAAETKSEQALLAYRVTALEKAMGELRTDVAQAATSSAAAAQASKATLDLLERRERRERGQ